MRVASKDETLRELQPFMAAFWRATSDGVRECFDYDASRLHILRKTSRRNNARDHIVDKLRAEIGSISGVVVRDENQTTIFGLFGRYEVKVKKADECGDVELAKGQLAWDFQCQRQHSFLDPLTNLYLGYIDTQDPREPMVCLICPREGGIEWMEELRRPADGVVEITPHPVAPDEGDDLVRVIPVKLEEESE
jgi:hypothetical protein